MSTSLVDPYEGMHRPYCYHDDFQEHTKGYHRVYLYNAVRGAILSTDVVTSVVTMSKQYPNRRRPSSVPVDKPLKFKLALSRSSGDSETVKGLTYGQALRFYNRVFEEGIGLFTHVDIIAYVEDTTWDYAVIHCSSLGPRGMERVNGH